ncbi:glycosyltransferase family 2 protein [Microgenomates group bacterium]|nr:glycosyltransferase family 2 protein [Microgenomates group bacterium]
MTKKIEDLTGIIIARDEEKWIGAAIKNLQYFCQSVIVVDNDSTDDTLNIANQLKVRTFKFSGSDFASIRNLAASKVETDFFLYLDADERVSVKLAENIAKILARKTAPKLGAIQFSRQNFFYGHEMRATGFEMRSDLVTRLFSKENFQKWTGKIHETAQYEGKMITLLEQPIWHFTHRSTRDNLLKSAEWTQIEAKLLAKDEKTPKITGSMILRKTMMEFWRRWFRGKAWQDGTVGMIESLTQAFNKAMVYSQVWEKQQQPEIEERYQTLEKSLDNEWQKSYNGGT